LKVADLKQRTIAGIAWSTGAHAGTQVIQFAIGVLLARLLSPEEFGLIGMVLVFSGFAGLFAEFGFASAIVQRDRVSELNRSSIFWLNLLIGCALALIFAGAAPLIADFFRSPQLEPIARALSLMFIIGAVGIVPRALLQKRMVFDRLARIEIVSSLAAGLLAVGLALAGFGVWSLVSQYLAAALITTGMALALCGWSPRLIYSRAAVRELLGYSANLFGFKFVNYWSRTADNLLIGRLIGSAGLGIYTRAYSLMLLPITHVIRTISRVMFPALAAVQNDKPRVARIYLRSTRMIALVSFPMMFGLFAVAEPFVLTLFGERWAGVVPVLSILCGVGVLQAVTNPVGWIYQSQGRTDWMFRWGVGASLFTVLALVIGASYGSVEAVAWAYLIANVLLFYPCIAIPGRLIGMTFSDLVNELWPLGLCAGTMAFLVWGLGRSLPPGWPVGAVLSIQVAVGVALDVALVPLLCRSAFDEVVTLFREQRQRLRVRATVA